MNEDNEKFCKKIFCESKDTLSGLNTKNKSNVSSKLLYSQFVKQRSINRKYEEENVSFGMNYSSNSNNLSNSEIHDNNLSDTQITETSNVQTFINFFNKNANVESDSNNEYTFSSNI